jgi:hypothetical protein
MLGPSLVTATILLPVLIRGSKLSTRRGTLGVNGAMCIAPNTTLESPTLGVVFIVRASHTPQPFGQLLKVFFRNCGRMVFRIGFSPIKLNSEARTAGPTSKARVRQPASSSEKSV